MSDYIYNDEDNQPMNDDPWAGPHNPTVYLSRAAEKSEEVLPFTDPGPDNGCWNCMEYDGNRCMKCWSCADPNYYLPDRDDKKPDDICEDWQKDKYAVREDYFEKE